MSTVSFSTSDNKVIEVPVSVANKMETIKNMLEDLGGVVMDTIPLPNVDSFSLNWIVKYFDPGVLGTNKEISLRVMKIEQIFNLILSSNYLDCKEVLEASCRAVSLLIENKTPEEIRANLNIKNDFTPEEMKELEKEREWTLID